MTTRAGIFAAIPLSALFAGIWSVLFGFCVTKSVYSIYDWDVIKNLLIITVIYMLTMALLAAGTCFFSTLTVDTLNQEVYGLFAIFLCFVTTYVQTSVIDHYFPMQSITPGYFVLSFTYIAKYLLFMIPPVLALIVGYLNQEPIMQVGSDYVS